MTAIEAAKYLLNADPNIEVVVLNKETYDLLLRKAKKLDEVFKHLRDTYKNTKKENKNV